MFTVEMLAADHGDCLWVEWGSGAARYKMLIDGGTANTAAALKAKLTALPVAARRFELVVITHIDSDHIAGVIELLRAPDLHLSIGEVWFNGYQALRDFEATRGALQGETLSALIQEKRLKHNVSFGDRVVRVPPHGPLPTFTLPGAMVLTLLSPRDEELRKLRAAWERECEAAGLRPGRAPPQAKGEARRRRAREAALAALEPLVERPFEQDDAPANGSSIAFLAQCEGAACLFTGDAYPEVINDSLERYFRAHGNAPLTLDAMKVPHHGSRNNLDWSCLQRFDCRRFLVSTDGGIFDHPDPETLARLVLYGAEGCEIVCNYRNPRVLALGAGALTGRHRHRVTVPDEGREGIAVRLV